MERYKLGVQLGSHIHTSGNVGKCEGVSPHTPKWTLVLGVRVLMDSQLIKEWFEGSKLIGMRIPYIIGKPC
jgi:hypothetical protein